VEIMEVKKHITWARKAPSDASDGIIKFPASALLGSLEFSNRTRIAGVFLDLLTLSLQSCSFKDCM
jgi:hypothetical protein